MKVSAETIIPQAAGEWGWYGKKRRKMPLGSYPEARPGCPFKKRRSWRRECLSTFQTWICLCGSNLTRQHPWRKCDTSRKWNYYLLSEYFVRFYGIGTKNDGNSLTSCHIVKICSASWAHEWKDDNVRSPSTFKYIYIIIIIIIIIIYEYIYMIAHVLFDLDTVRTKTNSAPDWLSRVF